MRPTPDQIQRARLVSLWRRRLRRSLGLTWIDYDPHDQMRIMGLEWPDGDEPVRPDILEANGHDRPNRTISNSPRPRPTPPDLETADDFPY